MREKLAHMTVFQKGDFPDSAFLVRGCLLFKDFVNLSLQIVFGSLNFFKKGYTLYLQW